MTLMTYVYLIAGLVLLVAGAEVLVRGAAKLAAQFGIPPLVIGLTVVAFGTSAPETAVSVQAALNGSGDIAIGNVVGSNIFNILGIAGTTALVMAAYVGITFWQFRNSCDAVATTGCYNVRDPLDLAILAASGFGACVGFLWWNASPAKIFMGDTGSLALGGALAGLSILTRTQFLAVVLGGLFLAEVMSDVIQVASFKSTGRRVFRMAPLHHHFELGGWTEVNVVIRFWIVAGVCVVAGLGLFYAEYLVS
mgnify:CR=1 FL=1